MEHDSEIVKLGKLLENEYFKKEDKNKVIIDWKIKFDFVTVGDKVVIHEIKKSNKLEKAGIYQILYYLYYLKKFKDVRGYGVIHYPTQNKTKKIELDSSKEKEIENVLNKIEKIIESDKPPKPRKKPYCKKCSYYELCWVIK